MTENDLKLTRTHYYVQAILTNAYNRATYLLMIMNFRSLQKIQQFLLSNDVQWQAINHFLNFGMLQFSTSVLEHKHVINACMANNHADKNK